MVATKSIINHFVFFLPLSPSLIAISFNITKKGEQKIKITMDLHEYLQKDAFVITINEVGDEK